MASLVELEPAPAITGTRPLASSMHHSTTRLCSSWLTVGLSPVVPTGTRPWVPSAICQFTSPRKAASSSEPFLNGVTKAVNEPRKFVLAAMDFLQTRDLRHCRHWNRQFISGLAIRRKGRLPVEPATRSTSRDFAAVMAQTSASAATYFSILSTYSIK